MSVHDGHRDRLRDCFRESGLAGFDEIRALELLLQYAIPRRDTNPIAQALLDRFGALQEVFDASEEELTEVEGIGPYAATLLRLVPEITRKSAVGKATRMSAILSAEDAWRYLRPHFLYERDEIAFMLCLDSQKRVIRCLELSRGVVNSVLLDVRRVVELALKYKASSVILAHNHPDGKPSNSHEDDITTQRIYQCLRTVGIPLEDHMILAEGSYLSYKETGMLKICEYM